MKRTGDTVATEAIMMRQVCCATVFVVEGDNDEKVLQKFTCDPNVVFISAWGKENAIDATIILDKEDVDGILTIVDADFWHIDGLEIASPNMLMTDDHDFEMMIIRSSCFLSMITELASKTKIDKVISTHGLSDVRELLLSRTLYVGYLRRYSQTSGLHLCFEGLKFKRFINRGTLEIDVNALVESVISLSRRSDVSKASLKESIIKLVAESKDDPYQVCCGHDFVAILGIGLRKILATKSKQAASVESIESALRLCYDREEFEKTQLYKKAKQWEKTSKTFTTFK